MRMPEKKEVRLCTTGAKPDHFIAQSDRSTGKERHFPTVEGAIRSAKASFHRSGAADIVAVYLFEEPNGKFGTKTRAREETIAKISKDAFGKLWVDCEVYGCTLI